MSDVSDVLIVSFDSGLKDESVLCVVRKCGENISMLKAEWGEQADILYHLLTEQMTKAEIKAESEKVNCNNTKCGNCKNHKYCDYEPQESEDKE